MDPSGGLLWFPFSSFPLPLWQFNDQEQIMTSVRQDFLFTPGVSHLNCASYQLTVPFTSYPFVLK